MKDFLALGVQSELCDVLYRQGIRVPTPIQEGAIPLIFKGRDIIGRAQTGTGKTLAYLLPLLQRIDTKKSATQALVLTPTRELAKQIFAVMHDPAKSVGADGVEIIGGRTVEKQMQKLKRDPQVIIGTPGRLLDHVGRHSLDLSQVKLIVLDEADQMLAQGFREEMERLIEGTTKKRQILLFSATMPLAVQKLARKYLHHPTVVDVSEKIAASTVEQRIYETVKTHKFSLLVKHLENMRPYLAVVFCNTKDGAAALASRLREETKLVVDEIHGNMTQSQRNHVMREFAKARIPILVASDIAARGLDVEGVTHVFNYDIPTNLEYYVHRVGRTGRAGTAGVAVTYATPEDGDLLRKLEKSIQETITRYDEKGNVRRVRKGKTGKMTVTPGMYKPTKQKEHKALGHNGTNMRRKKGKDLSGAKKKKRK